jgi:hypothetical protein
MESVIITAGPPDLMQADVLFASAAELEQTPPICDLLAVTVPIHHDGIAKITQYMPESGKVVVYS